MKKNILTATVVKVDDNKDETFEIKFDKDANQHECEVVVVRALQLLLNKFVEDSGLDFEEALKLYAKSVETHLGALHDMDESRKG
ncbi:MAG: hypothetical protein ABF991_00425 [Liquorilactobacillus hordei]|uniref:hypothetical protein n=1 Tax=Liquorilactobacillus hordei TaxID=468911 RepID=UPI0039E7FFC2